MGVDITWLLGEIKENEELMCACSNELPAAHDAPTEAVPWLIDSPESCEKAKAFGAVDTMVWSCLPNEPHPSSKDRAQSTNNNVSKFSVTVLVFAVIARLWDHIFIMNTRIMSVTRKVNFAMKRSGNSFRSDH